MKIPYAIQDFLKIRAQNYFYVDKTKYIETIENDVDYLMLLRPRRFGKSLLLSTLDYYYSINHKDKFADLFKGTYIYEHKTPMQGEYLVLNLDFAAIKTTSMEENERDFTDKIRGYISAFMAKYGEYLSQFRKVDEELIYSKKNASNMFNTFLTEMIKCGSDHKIYVLIDEYDHFANNIFTMGRSHFTQLIKSEGYLRPFFESIKEGCKSVIDKVFLTGTLPLLIDSLTSGANIFVNKSIKLKYNDILGFKQGDIDYLLKETGALEYKGLVKEYYNGYTFSIDSNEKLYNSDMILYFIDQYQDENNIPGSLIDPNIISDYLKIEAVVSIANKEIEKELIESLMLMEQIEAKTLEHSYSLIFSGKEEFTRDKILCLLYYMGYLTLKEKTVRNIILRVPNYMMNTIYYIYMHKLLNENLKTI